MLRGLFARLFLGFGGMALVCSGLGLSLLGFAFLDLWNPIVCFAIMIGGALIFLIGRRWERKAQDNRALRIAQRR